MGIKKNSCFISMARFYLICDYFPEHMQFRNTEAREIAKIASDQLNQTTLRYWVWLSVV